MENKRLKLIFFFLLLFLLLGANFVFALEVNYPRVPGATPPQDFIDTAPSGEILSLYVKYIFNLVIWIAGVIASGAIVMAGMKYLTSAGNPEGMTAARDQISAAFFGLLILLSSFLVLKIINPQFLILKMTKTEPQPLEKEMVPYPELKPLASSIDAEIPFGRIIEGGIFETYVQPEEQREPGMEKPRMTRLQENSKKTFEIGKALQIQNHRLTELTLGQELGTREKKILVFSSPNKTYLSELYSEEKKQPKVSLTATVLPPAQNIKENASYTFWCHCLYEGVNVDEMKDPSRCGPWDCRVEKGSPLDTSGPQQCTPEIRQIRIPNLSPNNFTAEDLCQYKEPGIYSPKVIVEREGLVNQLRTRVTVIPGLQNQSPQARTDAKRRGNSSFRRFCF